jgi:hypothetical protein
MSHLDVRWICPERFGANGSAFLENGREDENG